MEDRGRCDQCHDPHLAGKRGQGWAARKVQRPSTMNANTQGPSCSTSTEADVAPAAAHGPAAHPATQGMSLAANAGAVLSAFLASACCVGPLVLALLGLGGGALLASFEPYRPYFMVVTFSLLGFGFWLQYRTPKLKAGEACDCPTPRANRAGRAMLWVAAILVAGFLAFPSLVPILFS